jgi:hypothetical protein
MAAEFGGDNIGIALLACQLLTGRGPSDPIGQAPTLGLTSRNSRPYMGCFTVSSIAKPRWRLTHDGDGDGDRSPPQRHNRLGGDHGFASSETTSELVQLADDRNAPDYLLIGHGRIPAQLPDEWQAHTCPKQTPAKPAASIAAARRALIAAAASAIVASTPASRLARTPPTGRRACFETRPGSAASLLSMRVYLDGIKKTASS